MLITDLHIHSHYSRATSPNMNIQTLYRWAKIKGIQVIGTGDFTHPKWFLELQEKLEPSDDGLFQLKKEFADIEDATLSDILKDQIVRFIPTVEISNIYKKNGKVRKLHNIIVAPDWKAVSQINTHLARIGNISWDGRPILGLDSKELLKIALSVNENCLFIPAHIWTPWFGMFGSKSGFDSIEETFDDMSQHIYAVETGLSSDPFMNWRVNELQNKTIISNSDAHSAPKLGREANIINTDLSYGSLLDAIKTNDERFVGTIEFFPAEGKYHYDGHRGCSVSFHPDETKKLNNMCPVCSKELILGVDHRVDNLANNPTDYQPTLHKKVEYIVPLEVILSNVYGVGVQSKKVVTEYHRVTSVLGNEFDLLRTVSVKNIAKENEKLGIAIDKMRKGDVFIKPGYDGLYGVVRIEL